VSYGDFEKEEIMAKETTVVCPLPRTKGEPPHTQRVVGQEAYGAFLLECTVCQSLHVPMRSEVYSSLAAYEEGSIPLNLAKMFRAND
jgi:hypothetical protein